MQSEVLVNSHQYTFTNSTVPITEPVISNSKFLMIFLVVYKTSLLPLKKKKKKKKKNSCGSEESLVDTTLSILKMLLLCFLIILDLTDDHVILHIV